jgi:hypothetical protein
MGRIDRCLNCQEEKEILAHSLCATCYRRDERATKRAADAADTIYVKHAPGLTRDIVKLNKARHSLVAALHEVNASRPQILQILDILTPNFEPLKFMENLERMHTEELNTEQPSAAEQFSPERLNTEHSQEPEQFSTEQLNTEQTETVFSVQESKPAPVTAEPEHMAALNVQDILPSRRSRAKRAAAK